MPHITTHLIDGLIATGKIPPEDCSKLEQIKLATGHNRCSVRNAWRVARIVYRCLRSDDDA